MFHLLAFAPSRVKKAESDTFACDILTSIPFNSPPAKQSVHTHQRWCCCALPHQEFIPCPISLTSLSLSLHFFPRAASQAINSTCYTCGELNTETNWPLAPPRNARLSDRVDFCTFRQPDSINKHT